MKEDQKDQNSSEAGREHRAVQSSESAIIPELDAAPALDSEMYAVALCVEGLEAVKDDPRSLTRVINFIGSRYLDGLNDRRNALDAKIKILREQQAREEYAAQLEDTIVDVVNADGTVDFQGAWASSEVQAAFESGNRTVRKTQVASDDSGS